MSPVVLPSSRLQWTPYGSTPVPQGREFPEREALPTPNGRTRFVDGTRSGSSHTSHFRLMCVVVDGITPFTTIGVNCLFL